MTSLKKATKTLSVLDIVSVSLAIAYSLVYPGLVDSIEFTRTVYLDYMLWSVLGALALAAVSVVLFTVITVIQTIHCRKIIKEKSVIGACIVNVIFIALILIFIDKLDLWFIFA